LNWGIFASGYTAAIQAWLLFFFSGLPFIKDFDPLLQYWQRCPFYVPLAASAGRA
jgi:hypothetical protein